MLGSLISLLAVGFVLALIVRSCYGMFFAPGIPFPNRGQPYGGGDAPPGYPGGGYPGGGGGGGGGYPGGGGGSGNGNGFWWGLLSGGLLGSLWRPSSYYGSGYGSGFGSFWSRPSFGYTQRWGGSSTFGSRGLGGGGFSGGGFSGGGFSGTRTASGFGGTRRR
jgi:hypothetical protein